MINFKSRCNTLKNADRITRSVNYVYPHLSESKSSCFIENELEFLHFDSFESKKLQELKLKNKIKLKALRLKDYEGLDFFKNIINMIKNKKIANCYEKARLAEIIAKINGLSNIYPMKIFVTRNQSGAEVPIGHVVSVITSKEISPINKYEFKNKDAVIIDSWLGVTEFASSYIEKLKHDFKHYFEFIPDDYLNMTIIKKQANSLNEFNKLKKEKYFNPNIKFLLHEDPILTQEQALQLRNEYPELILDNFKPLLK